VVDVVKLFQLAFSNDETRESGTRNSKGVGDSVTYDISRATQGLVAR
jgi:hypothetical protein